MNDDELRRRLLDSVDGGGDAFWRRVDRSLSEVEVTDGFIGEVGSDDADAQVVVHREHAAPAVRMRRSRRPYRIALVAAAVAVIAAGAVGVGLFSERLDEVATNPATSSALPEAAVTTVGDEPDDAITLDDAATTTVGAGAGVALDDVGPDTALTDIPAGGPACYLGSTATSRHVARVDATGSGVFSGFVRIEPGGGALPVVDRFVGTLGDGGRFPVDVTRFDAASSERRNAEWALSDTNLTTEDQVLPRVPCAEADIAFADKGDPEVEALLSGLSGFDREIGLTTVNEGSDFRELRIDGVNVSAGEPVLFVFEAEAGEVATFRADGGSVPVRVVVGGPTGLAVAVDPEMNVVLPHSGAHQIVVTAADSASISVSVALTSG
ncbi:MAG: hypothetical protein AAF467_04235 [Actinomycetota bacterium]